MIPVKSLCLIAVCMPNYLPFFVVIVHGINKAYWEKMGPNFKMYLAKLPVQHLSKGLGCSLETLSEQKVTQLVKMDQGRNTLKPFL